MLRAFVAKWKASPRAGDRPDHVSSILVPFLIVTIGLAVLAWRSYVLSERMERGVNTLAMQYAGYAADISARRIDAAVHNELYRASEEWQKVERRSPSSNELQKWIRDNDWIISALYVPDADPASAIYASERPGATHNGTRLMRELYSSSGIVRYTYDPAAAPRARAPRARAPAAHAGAGTVAGSAGRGDRKPGRRRGDQE